MNQVISNCQRKTFGVAFGLLLLVACSGKGSSETSSTSPDLQLNARDIQCVEGVSIFGCSATITVDFSRMTFKESFGDSRYSEWTDAIDNFGKLYCVGLAPNGEGVFLDGPCPAPNDSVPAEEELSISGFSCGIPAETGILRCTVSAMVSKRSNLTVSLDVVFRDIKQFDEESLVWTLVPIDDVLSYCIGLDSSSRQTETIDGVYVSRAMSEFSYCE